MRSHLFASLINIQEPQYIKNVIEIKMLKGFKFIKQIFIAN